MSRDEAPRPVRPLVLPESFNGETDYCDWIDHFENVAALNAWDESAKLQWLKVRLTGRTQTALKRIPEATRRSYSDTLATLKRRFEPDSKRGSYAAEFQTRRKCKTEGWPDFAEDLQKLADWAYSYLQEEAKEMRIEQQAQPDENKTTVGVIGPPFSNQSPGWSTLRVELLDQMWDTFLQRRGLCKQVHIILTSGLIIPIFGLIHTH